MNRVVTAVVLALWLFVSAPQADAGRRETLEEAWSQAVANNPQLAAAQLEELAARDDHAAAAAGYLPAGWLQSSYSVRSDERSFLIDNPFSSGQTFSAPYAQQAAAGAGGGVTLPLYAGGAIENGELGAAARLAAAAQGTATARLALLLAVSEAYVAALRAQRVLEVAEQNLLSLRSHEAEVQRHYAEQRAPLNDVLAAEVAAANAQQLRLRRLNELASAEGEYNRLVVRPLKTPVELADVWLPPLALSLQNLQAIACQRRPELAQLQAAKDARVFEAQRLRAAARPHVNAVGRVDYEENRFQDPQALSTAAVILDWNAFDGGKSRRASCAELSRAASLGKRLEDLRSRIELDVLTQWNNWQETSARLSVAAQALAQADEGLRVSQLRFAGGLGVASEVLDAQVQRTQAASDYHNAGYDLWLAQIRLRYAAGILGSGD